MNEIQFFGEYIFDRSPMVLMRGFEIVDLPQKQLETLAVLLQANGNVVDRETLLDTVWKDAVVEEHNLTQTIFLLRKTLGKLPDGQEYIETVPKKGYRISPAALQQNEMQEAFRGDTGPPRSGEFPLGVPKTVHADPAPSNGGRRRSRFWNGKVALAGAIVMGVTITLIAAELSRRHPYLIAITQLTRDGIRKVPSAPLLLRDSSLLFTESRSHQAHVAFVAAGGGMVSSTRLPEANSVVSSFNPVSGNLLLSDPELDGPILSASPLGAAPQLLGTLRGHAAVWSPDGSRIAYASQRDLLISDASGLNRFELATVSGLPFWLSWSPDSKFIRFSMRESGGGRGIYQIELATREVTPVLRGDPNQHHACCGSWSEDGKYFVYVVGGLRTSSIWIRQERVLGIKGRWRSSEIASGPVDFWRSPRLSADLHHLYAAGEQMRNHLTLLNRNYQPFHQELSVRSASISHDGKWIAYTLHPEGSLWMSRFDGSDRVQLSGPGEFTRSPQWSGDDRSLIYLQAQEESSWSIARVDVDGRRREKSIAGITGISAIAYTPVGDRVAFQRQADPAAPVGGISTLSLSTRQVETVPSSAGLVVPRWSPDGRYISAVTATHDQLRIFDSVSRSWNTVASATAIGAHTWDPSANILYFIADRDGRHRLEKYTITNQAINEVAEIPEQYMNGHTSRVLEVTPGGDFLFGYSEGGVELYDLSVELR